MRSRPDSLPVRPLLNALIAVEQRVCRGINVCRRLFLARSKQQAETKLRKHHQKIEPIQEDHPVKAKHCLMRDPGCIADRYQSQECLALAMNTSGFQCFPYGDWPTYAKTDQHYRFEWTHASSLPWPDHVSSHQGSMQQRSSCAFSDDVFVTSGMFSSVGFWPFSAAVARM